MKHANAPIVALATGLWVAGSASAAIAAEGADGGSAVTLQEVIVTAQKREELSIDVPASVTAMDAPALARGGAVRLEDYAAQVPGLSITTLTRGYTSVVLRGISTGISQATPATAYYVDEAPVGSITAYAVGSTLTPDLDPAELQRIEVLKGPQGTLYGAGAVGGLLRYVTAAPDPSEFRGSVTLGGNTIADGADGWSARASLNAPTGDTSALRVSAFGRQEGGYIDNPAEGWKNVNEARTHGGRLAWGWQPNEDWSVLASAMLQRFRADGLGAEDLIMPTFQPATGDLERSTYIPEKQSIDLDVYNVTVKGQIGSASLVSSTTYQTSAASTTVDQTSSFGAFLALPPPLGLGIPGIGAYTTQLVDTTRVSEELRVDANALDDRLYYQVGLFVTDEDSTNRLPPTDPFVTATGESFPLGLPLADAMIKIKYREYSVFANATYSITPKFEVQGGLRYSRAKQDYTQDYQLALLTPIPVLIQQSVTQNKTTYLASLRYKPTDDIAVYARVATGYRPGGPSALPAGIIPDGKTYFDPDTLTSYELGLKSQFAEGRAAFEAALFTTDWKDIQIQTSTQTAAGTFQYFVNGGSARSRGAEATLTWLPVRGLTLRLTGAYTDSKLTEDAPAAGGIKGDPMPFVPKYTASFGVDYELSSIGDWQPFMAASYGYVDSRQSNFSGKNHFEVPSYELINASIGVDYKNFRVSLYGKNLGDERGINFLNGVGLALPVINPLGNPYAAGVVAPRTIGIELTAGF